MRILLSLAFLFGLLGCSGFHAGTATDVNSGTIAGTLTVDGKGYKEDITVSLLTAEGVELTTQPTVDGRFHFDSLNIHRRYALQARTAKVVQLGALDTVELSEQVQFPVKPIAKKRVSLVDTAGGLVRIDSLMMPNSAVLSIDSNSVVVLFALEAGEEQARIAVQYNDCSCTYPATMVATATTVDLFLTTANDLDLINRETVIFTGTGSDSSTIIIDGIIN